MESKKEASSRDSINPARSLAAAAPCMTASLPSRAVIGQAMNTTQAGLSKAKTGRAVRQKPTYLST